MEANYKKITQKEWANIAENVLSLENIYPETIRASRDDYDEIIFRDDSLAVVSFLENKLSGFALGFHITDEDWNECRLVPFKRNDGRSIYLESITIAPPFQGRGFGRGLYRAFNEFAVKAGFAYSYGHFRPNGSGKIAISEGAELLATEKNWMNTGEDYLCCRKTLVS